MKRIEVAIFFLFLLLSGIFCGCTTTPSDKNQTSDQKTYDSRLIGQWLNPRTREVLSFRADGVYTLSEAETETWYTQAGGKLWMFGTEYTYSFSENNTILSITEPGFTRNYERI
jgi:hypothetical protein